MSQSHEAKAGVVPIPRVKSEKKPSKHLRAKPRSKGSRAEREVIDILHARGYVRARRNWQSGGQGGADIIEGIPGFSIEVKHREIVAIWSWIDQAAEAAMPTESPLVVHRVNHQDWHVVLPREDLRSLLELNGNPPVFRVVRESGRVRLWDWMADARSEAPASSIPVVDFARLGEIGGWYSNLAFSTLLDLIGQAAA